jgi:hypothetical protein
MRTLNVYDCHQMVITATNRFGTVHLFVKCNRQLSNEEAIQLLKEEKLWMEEDVVKVSEGVREIVVLA